MIGSCMVLALLHTARTTILGDVMLAQQGNPSSSVVGPPHRATAACLRVDGGGKVHRMISERGSVELIDVTKRFGAVVAVDAVNLAIHPGEFVSLLGPSGCGKTTTLRMLAGFEQPDEGFIRVSGEFVQGVPPYRRDVNTVFQSYALFPHMTVAENVAYGLRQKRVAKGDLGRRVGEALDMVKMSHLASRKPRQLSGGQQQRVALARALVNRPSVLLLDEPLAALDRKLREEMQIELKLLQSQLGITFVFVTHDQEEAMSMSDRIAVMVDGRIEQLADPDTVYDRPATAFVAGFIGRNNFWKGTATSDGARVNDMAPIVAANRADGVVVGAASQVAVRPESITVHAADPGPGPNRVEGMVAGVAHLGDVMHYVVRTAAGDVLALVSRRADPQVPVGAAAWCTWDAGQAYVFPDSTSGLSSNPLEGVSSHDA
jgi:spermidine/putrescine transport system ATP-binding protein